MINERRKINEKEGIKLWNIAKKIPKRLQVKKVLSLLIIPLKMICLGNYGNRCTRTNLFVFDKSQM